MDLERFPTDGTALRMLDSVSGGFYDKSYVGKWLFQAMGMEMGDARRIVEELPYQAFPETATWGLAYHEMKWGLPVRDGLLVEERRGLILQKRGMREPMSPYAMERLLKSVTDFEAHVSDVNDVYIPIGKPAHPNLFDVALIGEGSADLRRIRELLDRVKQSHTAYTLIYYEHAGFKAEPAYGCALEVMLSFYPRFNLGYLNLDGGWRLDGGRKLNGYDSDSQVDFFPVGLEVTSGAKADTGASTGLECRIGWGPELDASTVFEVMAEATERTIEETSIHVGVGAICGIQNSAECTTVNRLDGGWKLDGRRKLNGGTEAL